ncbi:tRNA 5-methylaminomethyl-2-thiouridine biosynthesis bifunctional protein MnmC [invertebrate metagenome]|uniref:tRNA 5-methylaminomethyl-2-thiouridine biosynthesis bifunctional protein MnmC n=1 Tax=invertebrate metagenome TaxID=1711999 RepID=A0A2H9T5M6_9ZZZZ
MDNTILHISSPKKTAILSWDEQGRPSSTKFNDIYFSNDSGIEETRYVFLQHNHLKERFSALNENNFPSSNFVIGETGFGTGLNFLCTWQLFDTVAPSSATLHFISTEKYLLTPTDLEQALSLWPELKYYSKNLIQCWIPATTGQQHLVFENGRIKLTLLCGDILVTLPDLEGKVDAWFLDGFAPSKNPTMWQTNLFQTIAKKSHSNATYATFTAARSVRDGLTEAGFSVEKTKGFGHKRDMVCGQRLASSPISIKSSDKRTYNRPIWLTLPNHCNQEARKKTAIVIGGGLSGTSSAHALTQRGWKVTLIDRHHTLAAEASGNAQGLLYTKLSAHNTPLSQFIMAGYSYTVNYLRQYENNTELYNPCGLIQTAFLSEMEERQKELDTYFPNDVLTYLNADELSQIAGFPIHYNGLYFPKSGWVNPPSLCHHMAAHPKVTVKTGYTIDQLERYNGQWKAISQGTVIAEASVVIVACATSTRCIPLLRHLPLKGIRGQTTKAKATEQSRKLKTCVCSDGYVTPPREGFHTLGATFDFKSQSLILRDQDNKDNLSIQHQYFPDFAKTLQQDEQSIKGGIAGFRSTTPDYLPLVGAVAHETAFIEDYAPLRKNSKYKLTGLPQYIEGLYVNAGHGSRGLVTCPLSGEVLAALICDEPNPLPQHLIDNLNPNRFLARDLIRNKR